MVIRKGEERGEKWKERGKEIQFWKEGALEVIRLPAEFPRRELFEMSVELRSSSIYDGWWNIRDAPVIRRINSRRALSRRVQRAQSQLRRIDGNRFVATL